MTTPPEKILKSVSKLSTPHRHFQITYFKMQRNGLQRMLPKMFLLGTAVPFLPAKAL
jgi:hypothetical protein